MGVILSSATNRKHFSAAQMNSYSAALLQMYAVAIAPRFPFFFTMEEKGYGSWSGYIYHVSNTFRWRVTLGAGGNVVIKINDVQIVNTTTDGASGTKSIAGLGLTLGNIYTVTATCYTADSKITWLGELVDVSYTAPPIFADGNVLSVSDIEALRLRIMDLDTLAACPASPSEHFRIQDSIYGKSSDRGGDLWVSRGTFCWMGQNTLEYKFEHGATSAGQVVTVISLGSSTALSVAEYTGGATHQGTADVSSIVSGWTLGEFYNFSVRTKIEGTDKKVKCHCELKWLALSSDYAPAAAPNIWEHGDQDIDDDNLNWYSNLIKALFPGSGSEECALYYEYPAVRINEDNGDDSASDIINHSFYLQHRHKYLRCYATDDSTKTATLTYNGNKVSLGEEGTLITYDLDQIPALGYGEYYKVSDVNMAMETPTGD